MALPTYNRNNRRKVFEALPKGAYVIKILSAKTTQSSWGEDQIAIAFDIAEGEYKDFYKGQFDRNTSEDKKWPIDAIYYLTIPHDGCADYVVTNYDSFFADLEDSNNGFVFSGDEKSLKGKLIGAKTCAKARPDGFRMTNWLILLALPAMDLQWIPMQTAVFLPIPMTRFPLIEALHGQV